MQKRSSQAGGSAVPVGGIVMMHEDYPATSFAEGGAEYLRSGVVVPFDAAKHADIAALGFTYNRYPLTIDHEADGSLGGMSYSASNPIALALNGTYAMGQWGRLRLLETDVDGSEVYAWAAQGLAGGYQQPRLIKTPPTGDPYSSTPTRSRTRPAWLSAYGVWAFAEQMGGNSSQSLIRVYLSRDGISWTTADASIPTQGGYGLAQQSAASANALFFGFVVSGSTTLYRIDIGEHLDEAIVTLLGVPLMHLVTVGPDDVLVTSSTASPAYALYASSSKVGGALVLLNSMDATSGGSNLLTVTRNDTTIVVCQHGVSGVNKFLASGPSVMQLTARTANPNSSSTAAINAMWTGAFFVLMSDTAPANNYAGWAYSADQGATWTSYNGGATSVGTGNKVSKHHIKYAYNGASAFKIRDMRTGVDADASTTTGPLGMPQHLVQAFGKTFGFLPGAGVVSVSQGLGEVDLVYPVPVASASPAASTAPLMKLVNGRLFVLNVSGNALIYTDDGITWTYALVPSMANIIDVGYLNGLWVVGGSGTGRNLATSPDMVTWAGATLNAAANWVIHLFTVGSRLVAAVGGTGANPVLFHTADATVWSGYAGLTASGGTAADSYPVVVDALTAHLFVRPLSASNKVYRITTTDGGATWSLSQSSLSLLPHGFVKRGARWYCFIGSAYYSGAAINGDSGVFTTTDFNTFTAVPMPVRAVATPAAGNCRFIELDGALMYRSNVAEVLNVLEAQGAGFVGSDKAVKGQGTVGYLRIK